MKQNYKYYYLNEDVRPYINMPINMRVKMEITQKFPINRSQPMPI